MGGLLVPVFQPIVDLRSGRILGFEALIRPDPRGPLPDTGRLFAAAEAVGRTVELDRACIEAVLRVATAIGPDRLLTLNISPRTLEGKDFDAGWLLQGLYRAGISPGRVIIELTERDEIADLPRLRKTFQHLQQYGLRLAADDVGAGNAGLRLLSRSSSTSSRSTSRSSRMACAAWAPGPCCSRCATSRSASAPTSWPRESRRGSSFESSVSSRSVPGRASCWAAPMHPWRRRSWTSRASVSGKTRLRSCASDLSSRTRQWQWCRPASLPTTIRGAAGGRTIERPAQRGIILPRPAWPRSSSWSAAPPEPSPRRRSRAGLDRLRHEEARAGALMQGAPDGTHRPTVGDDGSSSTRAGRQRAQRGPDLGHHPARDDALGDEALGLGRRELGDAAPRRVADAVRVGQEEQLAAERGGKGSGDVVGVDVADAPVWSRGPWAPRPAAARLRGASAGAPGPPPARR